MTRALPPMASFSELVTTAVRAATHHLAEGSRRNAREALEVRYDLTRDGFEVMAALSPQRSDIASLPPQHRSTA
jgi:hypothetical protein